VILSMSFLHRVPRSRGFSFLFLNRKPKNLNPKAQAGWVGRIAEKAGQAGGFLVALAFHAAYIVGAVAVLKGLPSVAPGLDATLFSQVDDISSYTCTLCVCVRVCVWRAHTHTLVHTCRHANARTHAPHISQEGVVVVGTLMPLVESIRAVITVRTNDDAVWLQYWLAAGCFTYATEFLDSLIENPNSGELWNFVAPILKAHWYEFEFFFLVWLSNPLTDGATLMYDLFTKPVLVPILKPLKVYMCIYIQ